MDLEIIEKHFSIWTDKKLALIPEVYATDIEIIDPHSIAHGQQEARELITALQAKFPERKFRLRKPIEGHHDIARLFWAFGPAEDPELVTGQDVLILEAGKIAKLLIFIDPK